MSLRRFSLGGGKKLNPRKQIKVNLLCFALVYLFFNGNTGCGALFCELQAKMGPSKCQALGNLLCFEQLRFVTERIEQLRCYSSVNSGFSTISPAHSLAPQPSECVYWDLLHCHVCLGVSLPLFLLLNGGTFELTSLGKRSFQTLPALLYQGGHQDALGWGFESWIRSLDSDCPIPLPTLSFPTPSRLSQKWNFRGVSLKEKLQISTFGGHLAARRSVN